MTRASPENKNTGCGDMKRLNGMGGDMCRAKEKNFVVNRYAPMAVLVAGVLVSTLGWAAPPAGACGTWSRNAAAGSATATVAESLQ